MSDSKVVKVQVFIIFPKKLRNLLKIFSIAKTHYLEAVEWVETQNEFCKKMVYVEFQSC